MDGIVTSCGRKTSVMDTSPNHDCSIIKYGGGAVEVMIRCATRFWAIRTGLYKHDTYGLARGLSGCDSIGRYLATELWHVRLHRLLHCSLLTVETL